MDKIKPTYTREHSAKKKKKFETVFDKNPTTKAAIQLLIFLTNM